MADRPDVYVSDLKKSVVLEIKATEIMASDSYPTKCTLRFPRVVKIRYDKPADEAMTRQDLEKVIKDF
jgi:DNA ligase-4